MPGLGTTYGRGGATTAPSDLVHSDAILIMGSNMAENHPVAFQWVIEARERGARVIHVDPRFTRTSAMADLWVPLRAGSDIVLLGALVRYVLEERRDFREYVLHYTNAPVVLRDDMRDTEDLDGVFSGWDPVAQRYDATTWAYAAGPEGATGYQQDLTLQHPRCVYQVLRRHFARYTPELVERACGVPPALFLDLAEAFCSASGPEKTGSICYALGWTQHSKGVQMIRAAAMLQLLLGNVGRPGGGVNAFRGHSNIQGATDIAGTFEILPGYLKTPSGPHQTLADYLKEATPTTLNGTVWPSMNYWSNYPKFMVSLLKAQYGKNATKENDWGYSWLPKIDGNHSWMYIFDDMYRGSSTRAGGKEPGPEGLITFGMNPVGIGPNVPKMIAALSKLKWLLVVENYEIETATFWKAPKEYGTADASKIPTEVYQLPASGFAEKDGTFINSARWMQWKWKAIDPPGQAKTDQEIMARIFLAVRDLYKKEGGAFPEAVANVSWS